ncbi:Anaphase-promoting complex subunit 10 [Glycine max]|nr:Anaphase-promoting complex subunit 10 [Glycine max]
MELLNIGFIKTDVNYLMLTSLKRVKISQLAHSKTLLHSFFSFSSHLKSVGNRSKPLAGTHRTSYRRKVEENPALLLELCGSKKPYTALGTVVGAQSSKLSTLPVNKVLIKLLGHFVHLANHIKVSIRIVMWGFILLWQLIVLDKSYTPSKVSIRAGDGFHNLKIKTVELVKPTGWVYLSLSRADPSDVHIN